MIDYIYSNCKARVIYAYMKQKYHRHYYTDLYCFAHQQLLLKFSLSSVAINAAVKLK